MLGLGLRLFADGCGQVCQTRAWKAFHKFECGLFGRLRPRVLPSMVRADVRVLRQHDAGLVSPLRWDELLALESHYDELLQAGGQRWQDVFIMMKGIKSYCGTEHSQDTILRLACVVRKCGSCVVLMLTAVIVDGELFYSYESGVRFLGHGSASKVGAVESLL